MKLRIKHAYLAAGKWQYLVEDLETGHSVPLSDRPHMKDDEVLALAEKQLLAARDTVIAEPGVELKHASTAQLAEEIKGRKLTAKDLGLSAVAEMEVKP